MIRRVDESDNGADVGADVGADLSGREKIDDPLDRGVGAMISGFEAAVVEFDIKGLFDNIPHDLLLKAVRKHVKCKWALLYIERWLTAPMEQDGTTIARHRGTPQGGVISPILANLFLHYAFDLWMRRAYPDLPWCRYADDGLVHCRTEHEAEAVKTALQARLSECRLELHPTKVLRVWPVMEPAIGERSTQALVEEEKKQRQLDSFLTEAVGVA